MRKGIFINLKGEMLKDFRKATKKDLEQIEDIFLYGIEGGCTYNDLFIKFEKINNLKIKFIKNNWLCCNNRKRYKIQSNSYILNYDGFLRF